MTMPELVSTLQESPPPSSSFRAPVAGAEGPPPSSSFRAPATGIEGSVRPLDAALARWMAAREPEYAPALEAAAHLLSRARRDGHTALSLANLEENEHVAELREAGVSMPSQGALRDGLAKSTLVGAPGDRTPLVLEGDLLFFRRFHAGECRIVEVVRRRLERAVRPRDIETLTSTYRQLFEPEVDGDVNWQAVAAAAALRNRFVCIAGGPGTGKTTAVARLMVLLLKDDPELRIMLASPTGKAAHRMAESIRRQLEALDVDDDLKERIPTTAATLHRLLGYRPAQAQFNYRANRKLEADVVIVDEASMIDHELFTSLIAALDDETRLILLGDPDQLPSVEAGFVFGDLCRSVEGCSKSTEFGAFLEDLGLRVVPPLDGSPPRPSSEDSLPGLPSEGSLPGPPSEDSIARRPSEAWPPAMRDAVITLTRGYRFGPESGIGQLAYALRDGRSDEAVHVLRSGEYPDLRLVPHDEQKGVVRRAVRDFASSLLGARSPSEALATLERLRILTPVRIGPRGVEALNEDLEGWLLDEGIRPWGRDYAGKPILITTNDYDVSLFNGDVGVLWKRGDRFVGCFADGEDVREVPLHRLPPHEVAWAMTVHKAQGSEFDDIVLVLPDREDAGHLTRELLYTAVTRARASVTIIGEAEVVAAAACKREQRVTGLGRLLRETGLEPSFLTRGIL